jgi:hypothetical protein
MGKPVDCAISRSISCQVADAHVRAIRANTVVVGIAPLGRARVLLRYGHATAGWRALTYHY